MVADSRIAKRARQLSNPLDYEGLRSGPGWANQYQTQQSIPIDGTQARLRDPEKGSPFTISVVPPDILLQAIQGTGAARTSDGLFDPKLQKLFKEADKNFNAVLTQVRGEGVAEPFSDPRVIEAREAYLGTRAPPTSSQNIGIMEASLRSTNRFSEISKRQKAFRGSNLFAVGPRRDSTLSNIEEMIGLNGVRFNPQRVSQTAANQVAISDLDQALSVLVQLNRIVATPPLTLLVNPEEMSINYSKKQTYQDRSRFNYIFQSWGEEQPRMSFSGKSGGFVAGSDGRVTDFGSVGLGGIETSTVSGYQWASKRESAAWQNLMNLFTIYRNNAVIYNELDRSEAHLFVGNVQIQYDQWVYLGQFENFNYSYSETKQQGAIDFSFDFVVSFMFDLHQGGGQKPVKPIPSVTPSPSDPKWVGGGVTVNFVDTLPSQQPNTTRGLPTEEVGSTGTAILNPIVTDLVLDQLFGGTPDFSNTPGFGFNPEGNVGGGR